VVAARAVDVQGTVDTLRYFAGWATKIHGRTVEPSLPGNYLAYTRKEPIGVVGAIVPWNFPLQTMAWKLGAALAAGCTIVVKPAELTSLSALRFAELVQEAGIPDGVINIVTGRGSVVGAAMATHPGIDKLTFTGSTPVGRLIAQTCAKYLKPVVLELGGKAPLLVLDDADIDQAAAGATFGAFANAGQICMSTERIIVEQDIAEPFIDALVKRVNGLPDRLLGSVVDKKTVDRCNALIDDALAKGARLLTGGKADTTQMRATLLDGVTRSMRIWQEESFGPVKAIIRVQDEQEALTVANESEYGLSSAVYSRDTARAWNVAQRLQTGICHINGPTVHDEAQMPFGGCKASGYGRFGGRAGVAEFTELRWITLQTSPRELPF
jgi:benzaldehyde dehydrogenase (NAD)